MFQQDYLLREIERLGQLLSELRRQLLAGEVDDVRRDVDALAAQLGVDLSLATTLEPSSLMTLLGGGSTPDPAKLLATGELLYIDALIAAEQNKQEREEQSLERARLLLTAVLNTSDPVPEEVKELAREFLEQIEGDRDRTGKNGANSA